MIPRSDPPPWQTTGKIKMCWQRPCDRDHRVHAFPAGAGKEGSSNDAEHEFEIFFSFHKLSMRSSLAVLNEASYHAICAANARGNKGRCLHKGLYLNEWPKADQGT